MPDTAVGPRLQVLGAAALFSTGGAAIKAVGLTSWQVAGFRSAVALAAILWLLPASRRRWRGGDLAIGAAYAGALVFYVLANKLTTAANTIFLQSTAPLYVLFLAPWLLGEHLRRRDLLFMAAMAAGLGLFFVRPESAVETAPRPFEGNLLAAMGGVCWALAVVGLRWRSRGELSGAGSPAPAVAAGNLIACLICLPFALPVEESRLLDWALVVALGVFQVALAYVFLTRGLRRVQAFEASLLLLAEPVLNPLWAWWIHDERPAPWALAGGAIIVLVTALRTLQEYRVQRRRPDLVSGDAAAARRPRSPGQPGSGDRGGARDPA